MRLNLFDFRSPPRWSKADRERVCDRAMVGVAWDRSPFGMRPVQVLPNIQPGVWRAGGAPVVTENGYMRQWGEIVDASGWSLSDSSGAPLSIWSSGSQSLTPVDLSRVEVVEAWVDHVLYFFPWASGVHLDYFTNLAWLFPPVFDAAGRLLSGLPLEYWRGYDLGLAFAAVLLKRARPDWHVSGGQYHTTPITRYADSLFLEEGPTHFEGQTFESVEASMDAHGGGRDWTVELRHPERLPAWYIAKTLELVRRRGCLLSWRRDSESLVGVPA